MIRAYRKVLNVQYTHPHKTEKPITASFIAGLNFHDNQINVGLYPREGRVPNWSHALGPMRTSLMKPAMPRRRSVFFAADY